MSERRLSTIRTWLASILVAAIAGFGTGILAGAFRLTLDAGGNLRTALILTLHDWPFVGSVLFILLAAMATVTAAWLVVRFAPTAAGSGIPRVQSVLDGDLPPAPPAVMPVKFVAASLGIVRRQNIWHNSRRRFAECGPRLRFDVRRRACGVASADTTRASTM